MSHIKKLLAAALALAIAVLPFMPTAVAAAGNKEEVVYANLDAAGNLEKAYVVNSFDSGSIKDYGAYSAVRMLNTDDAITLDGDMVRFTSDARRIYYEGTLANPELPWLVDISYQLDGRAVTPKQLAGDSGQLDMNLKISRNPNCSGSFYDDYALQATVTLDTALAEDIEAPDATVAIVGGDKQLTYTVLPGKGLDTTITADVENFTMDAVSINGVRLNLDVDVDTSEMKDQVNELISATVQLDNGAVALADGARTLKSGSQEMTGGTASLTSGIASLDSGVDTLQQGMKTMQQGLDALDAQSDALNEGSEAFADALSQLEAAVAQAADSADLLEALVDTATQLKRLIDELLSGGGALQNAVSAEGYAASMQQNGIDIDSIATQNSQTAATISRDLTELQTLADQLAATPGMEEEAEALRQIMSDMSQTEVLLETNNTVHTDTSLYLDGLGESVAPLVDGLGGLQESCAQFEEAVAKLADKLLGMTDQLDTLSEALTTLNDSYAELDDGVHAYTDGVSQLASGYGAVMQGVSSLASGSGQLLDASGSLDEGSRELYNGVASLADGAQTLAQGTGTLRSETSGIDGRIDEEVQKMTAGLSADDAPVQSFTSTKNTDVQRVQFVLQTEAIALNEEKPVENDNEEHSSFWQKLLDLFK